MESRIRPAIEDQFGPILLVTETSNPQPEDIENLVGCENFVVCDFYIQGCEEWTRESWGYSRNGLAVIDHHSPDKRWERRISSGNLARHFVEMRGNCKLAVINHTDCDSVISAGIATGFLKPSDAYDKAVVAADHTGRENQIADLLQSITGERNLALSFECLKNLEQGTPIPERASGLLEDRRQERLLAMQLVSERLVERGKLACFESPKRIEGELVSPFVPNSWAVAIVFPMKDSPHLNEVKCRLTESAPKGLSLQRLGIKKIDPAFGGRWNAGSNNRGGGTSKRAGELFEGYAKCLQKYELQWMLGKAVQIASKAHEGQFDKAGSPYFLHPLRVMNSCQNPIAKVAGALHDVVEDCEGWNFERLAQEGISDEVIDIVKLLTHVPSDQIDSYQDYMDYVARCGENEFAREVKLADLDDNLDTSRLQMITSKDEERLEKYWAARQMLLSFSCAPGIAASAARQRSRQSPFVPKSFGNLRTSYTVRVESGQLVEVTTGANLDVATGAIAEIVLKDKDLIEPPTVHSYSEKFDVEFLKAGVSIFAGVKIKELSDELKATLFDLQECPVRLAKWNPEDPLSPKLLKPKVSVQLVEMILCEDLLLTSKNTKIPKLSGCGVWVPALEENFDSVNQAYSRISSVFEPWRRSTASNAFRTAYTMVKVEVRNSNPYWRLEPLEFLRNQVENVRHLMTKQRP